MTREPAAAQGATEPGGAGGAEAGRTMRAVVYHGRKDFRVDRVPRPRLENEDDALVRVTTAAVCGSDLHLYHSSVPRVVAGEIVLGHEQVGVVEEVGSAVRGVSPGDRVVVSGLLVDGSCWYCRQGLFSQCQGTNPNPLHRMGHGQHHGALLGFGKQMGGYGGGHAEMVRVPHADANLLRLPDDVPDEKAVFLSDVLNVAWMANDLARTGPGTSVAVWGCGPVGQLALHCARARGATRLFAIDHHADRLALARERSGAVPVDFDQEDPYEVLMRHTEGRGPDVGVDCTGFRFSKSLRHKVQRMAGLETDAADALGEMARCVRGGGTLVVAGFYVGFANQFPVGALMQKNLHLVGSSVDVQRHWRVLLEKLRSGELDPTFVVSHVLPLDEAEDAYRLMDERRALKVLLKP